jgi:beta-lysine N6-acetyltransferase
MTGWIGAAMPDRLEPLGSSVIQHGKNNDRIYLMHLAAADVPWILKPLANLARRHRYGKIFAKVPADLVRPFRENGYETEAVVPGFFRRSTDGHFLARYFDPARKQSTEQGRIRTILAECGRRRTILASAVDYHLRRCLPADAENMAELFGEVFPSYPFPVQNPAYLREIMQSRTAYFGAWQGETLTALAAAEQTTEEAHVEMTDFATAPDHRRQGLASALLTVMEEEMRRRQFRTAYTIARALSPGMNFTFANAGYHLGGTLINNTQIGGRIESMNVWHKDLMSWSVNSEQKMVGD